MVLVAEVPVEFYDVGVVQHVEDLQLQAELLLHAVLLYGRFEKFFEGEDEACCFVSADIDLSELARTNFRTDLKLPQGKMLAIHLIVLLANNDLLYLPRALVQQPAASFAAILPENL